MSFFSRIKRYVRRVFSRRETVSTSTSSPRRRGVVVTDFSSGASVTTKTSDGKITSQSYSRGPSSRGSSRGRGLSSQQNLVAQAEEKKALELANRPGGTVSRTISRQLQSPEKSESKMLGKAPPNVVSEVKRPKGFFGRAQASLDEARSKLQTEKARDLGGNPLSGFSRNVKGFGLGFAGVFVKTGAFGQALVTKPQETITETGKGVYGVGKRFFSGEGFPEVGKTIENEPGFATGSVVGEVTVARGLGKAGEFTGKGYGRLRTYTETSIVKEVPTLQSQKIVQPFTRQRATLLLKEETTGKYILGTTREGTAISIGGGIEKGQSARGAVLSELKQETGLGLRDIKNLRRSGKVVFPEETHHVYSAEIKDASIINPSSDIKSLVKVSPSQAKGITGQTKFNPVYKKIFSPYRESATGKKILFPRIRSYELGIINKIEFGEAPTWLSVSTKQGRFYLGTQSRYNVPFSSQSRYLKEESLRLAHGTQNPPTLEKFYSYGKPFEIDPTKTARGKTKGLYVQPPVSPSRFPEVKKLVGYTGKGEFLKQTEIKKLPLGLKKEIQEGYFGLSYAGVGFDSPAEGFKFSFRKPKRAFYTFNEKPEFPVSPTQKTFSGVESELIIKEGIIETTGKSKTIFIENKKVSIQPARIQKQTQELSGISDFKRASFSRKKEIRTFEYSQLNYRYITPSELIKKSPQGFRFFGSGSLNKQFSETKSFLSRGRNSSYSRPSIPIEEGGLFPSPRKPLTPSEPSYSPPPYRYGGAPPAYSPPIIPPPLLPPGAPPEKPFKQTLSIKQTTKLKPSLFSQPKKYQPTFSAAALNIKAPKIPKAYSSGAGSLIQRPVVAGRRKKR